MKRIFIAIIAFEIGKSIDAFAINSLNRGVSVQISSTYPSVRKKEERSNGYTSWQSLQRHEQFVLSDRKRWDDEIEENSLRRAQSNTNSGGSGIGEAAAGAVLGGLLGGPFGTSGSSWLQLTHRYPSLINYFCNIPYVS
jgi:hypothetical protein